LGGVAQFGSLMLMSDTSPPIGELSHFTCAFTPILAAMSMGALDTSIGLGRVCRCAWIFILVFGGLLTAACTPLIVACLLLSEGEVYSWLGSVATLLTFLP
jgi:hypothetical protein